MKRLAESQKVANFMLSTEQVLIASATDDICCNPNLPPRPTTHQICHAELNDYHGQDLPSEAGAFRDKFGKSEISI